MTHTITIVGLGNYGIDELPLGKKSLKYMLEP